MIEMTFDDGRVRTVTPQYYTTAEPFGGCCMAEFDLRFDDLSEGLRLEVSHHGPSGPRSEGEFCLPPLRGDASLMLLDRDELDRVVAVRWEGRLAAARVGGELVVLTRVGALAETYAPACEGMPVLEAIGRLAGAMRSSAAWRACLPAGCDPAEADEALASAVGVTARLLALAEGAWAREAEEYDDEGGFDGRGE